MSSGSLAGLASQACSSCRKQRRRCTRELPACLLCRRLGKACEYSESLTPRSVQDELVYLRNRVAELENRLAELHSSPNSSSTLAAASWTHASLSSSSAESAPQLHHVFPAAFFLDSEAFRHSGQTIIPPHVEVPCHLADLLEEEKDVAVVVAAHFSNFHAYFPIISKIRTYQWLADCGGSFSLDMKLLTECMQLFQQPTHSYPVPATGLYASCKALYAYAEGQNAYSIYLLQALVLIAVYEVAHAMYPAAYITVGHCTRVGISMGLHDQKSCTQILPRSETSVELEERRRVWWAVVILEMYVNLGSRAHPLACPIQAGDFLPQEDECWDRGEMVVVRPIALSASATIKTSPFARICQTVHVLSRVLHHVDDKNINLPFRYDEAVQLRKTVESLSDALAHELNEVVQQRGTQPYSEMLLLTALGLSYSAQLSLHERYACAESMTNEEISSPEQLELHSTAITRIPQISNAVLHLAAWIKEGAAQQGVMNVSPLLVDCLYQSAATFSWLAIETRAGEHFEKLAELREVLQIIGARWDSANEYVKIIDARAT